MPARSVTWVAKEASQGGGPSGHEGREVAIRIAKERVLPSGRSMPARLSFRLSIPVSRYQCGLSPQEEQHSPSGHKKLGVMVSMAFIE